MGRYEQRTVTLEPVQVRGAKLVRAREGVALAALIREGLDHVLDERLPKGWRDPGFDPRQLEIDYGR